MIELRLGTFTGLSTPSDLQSTPSATALAGLARCRGCCLPKALVEVAFLRSMEMTTVLGAVHVGYQVAQSAWRTLSAAFDAALAASIATSGVTAPASTIAPHRANEPFTSKYSAPAALPAAFDAAPTTSRVVLEL